MLLQCGTDSAEAGVTDWLRRETLESLRELNEETLMLLAEQARLTAGNALLQQVGELWRGLDGAGRARAGGCLYLLLDADFAEPLRWQRLALASEPLHGSPFFNASGSLPLAHAAFTFAWHLSRCQGSAARLLLGMPATGVALLARYTLREVRELAAAQAPRLRPRWWNRPAVWRQLLLAAGGADAQALQRARLYGQTLLAAGLYREARRVPRLSARPPTLGRRAAPPGELAAR